MNLLRLFLLMTALLPASGCLILAGARNLLVEPVAAFTLDCLEAKRNEALAVAAWKQVLQENPGAEFSVHYAEGFRQGFVDYLNAGGTGAPPPVPPRKYWGVRYETPEGHAAMQDWFAGFRHGADTAAQSGYREFIVLPTPIPPSDPNPYARQKTTRNGETETKPEELPTPPKEIPKANE
ncbi:MAG: hypothetical protein NZM31_04795 [Gemmatales bacterium]|nr:hypothetical protein [Gemmatales bacterium]MDW8386316.1 hypothetical protein [Gemmatales bacterium]